MPDNDTIPPLPKGYVTVNNSNDTEAPPLPKGYFDIKKKIGGNGNGIDLSTQQSQNGTSDFANAKQPNGVISNKQVLGAQQHETTTTEQQNAANYGQQLSQAEQQKKRSDIRDAAVNSANLYFKNNPTLLEGLNDIHNKDISLKNAPQTTDEFSLKSLKNTSLFQKKVGELMNAHDNGDLVTYPSPTGELRMGRNLGNWGNFTNGLSDAWSAKEESNKILNMSKDDFIKHTNEALAKDEDYLPAKPNTESLSYQAGSAVPMLGKGVVAATAGGIMEALAPETAGLSTVALPTLTAWAATVPDMAIQAKANSLVANYNRYKKDNPNATDSEAYDHAQTASNLEGIKALAEGTALNLIAPAAIPKAEGQSLLKATGQWLKNQPPSILAATAAGAGSSYLKDVGLKQAGYNISGQEMIDNADKEGGGMIPMQLAFNIAHGVLPAAKYLKAQSLEYLSKLPPEVNQELSQQAVQNGWVTQQQADQTNADLNQYSHIRNSLPQDLPSDKAAAVTGLLQKNANLEAEKKTLNPIVHDDINLEIDNNETKAKQILNSNAPLKHETDNLTGERGQNVGGRPTKEENGVTVIMPKPNEENVSVIQPHENYPNENVITIGNEKETKKPIQEGNAGSNANNEPIPSNEKGKTEENVGEIIQPQQEEIKGFEAGTKIYRAGDSGRYFSTDKQYIREGGFKYPIREFTIPKGTKLLDTRTETGGNDFNDILNLATDEEKKVLKQPRIKGSEEAKKSGDIVDNILKRNGYDGYIMKDAGETKDFDTVVFRKDKSPNNQKQQPKENIQSNIISPINETGANKIEPVKVGKVDVSEHGEDTNTKNNLENGTEPTSLSAKGKEEATALGKYIYDHDQYEIVTSDVERAEKTANKAAEEVNRLRGIKKGTPMEEANGIKVETSPLLRTWDIGEYDGKPEGSFDENNWANNPDKAPKGGESFNDFKNRVLKAYDYVKTLPETTHVITHSKVMRAFEALNKTDGKWTDETTQYFLNNKEKQNANPIREDTGRVSKEGGIPETSQNNGSENIQRGTTETQPQPTNIEQQAGQQQPEESKGSSEEKGGELITTGGHHEALNKIADRLGLPPIKEGDVLSPEEYTKRGQLLLRNGADPQAIADEFEKTGKVNAETVGIAKAHLANLDKAAENARKVFGEKSNEFEKAKKEADDWARLVMKPMGTKFGEIGRALQGETDIDTGNFVSLQRAFEDKNGKPMTPSQKEKGEKLSNEVKDLNNQISDLKQKLTDALDKNIELQKKASKFTEKAKNIADKFRKLKTKPFTFKDENGNDIPIQIQGISWNDLVELGAKAIEKTGEIADGVAAIIDKIKDSEVYLKLSANDREKLEQQLTQHYESAIEETPEAKNIKRLEKQLEDLKKGKVKQEGAKRELSPKEKELQNKIFEEKQKLGLIKPKAISPEEKQQQHIGDVEKLASRFADKKDNKFSPEDVKDIWEYAKENYLNHDDDFSDMVNGVATDLGLTPEQVRHALAEPKAARRLTDEMYIKQYQRRKAQQKAEYFVNNENESTLTKITKFLPRIFFNIKTFGHGTVGFITHAGTSFFNPASWKIYFPLFLKQFKYSFGGLTQKGLANYEKAMDDLKRDKYYAIAKRSGLAVDPDKVYDDYQNTIEFLKKYSEMGDRGFNTLKILRLELFKQEYGKLSQLEKADPQTAKNIASIINHATGTSDVKLPNAASTAFFAPKLEASRWSRLITQPAKAINTFANWDKSSASDKVAAKIVVRRAGNIIATYIAGLAANHALLSLSGSKQSINFTRPNESDFLKYKAGGRTLDLSGGMISAIDLLSNLAHIATESKGELGKNTRGDLLTSTTGRYITGKFSPFMGTVKDFSTHHDFEGNTMPFSNDKPMKGKHYLTWGEYFKTQQSPIPVAEAFKDIHKQLKDNGMNESQINAIMQGIFVGAFSGSTGVRVGEEPVTTNLSTSPKTTETRGVHKEVKHITR